MTPVIGPGSIVESGPMTVPRRAMNLSAGQIWGAAT
jgi:hypothetical protein